MNLVRARISKSAVAIAAAGCFVSLPLHAEPAQNVCASPRDASVSLLPRARENLLLRVAANRPRALGQLVAPKPSAPPVASSSTSRELTLEIKDTAPGRAPAIERFTVPVTPGEASKLESRVGDASYQIAISDDGVRPLTFDVERDQREADSRWSKAKLRTSLRLKPGQKAVIARIDHADGRRTELTATLR